jgi:hypothetical protein
MDKQKPTKTNKNPTNSSSVDGDHDHDDVATTPRKECGAVVPLATLQEAKPCCQA